MRKLSSFTLQDVRDATTPDELNAASLGLLLSVLAKAYPEVEGSTALLCVNPSFYPGFLDRLRREAPGLKTATESFRPAPDYPNRSSVIQAIAPVSGVTAPSSWGIDVPAWTLVSMATAQVEDAARIARNLGGIVAHDIPFHSEGGLTASLAAIGNGYAAIPGIRDARGPYALRGKAAVREGDG